MGLFYKGGIPIEQVYQNGTIASILTRTYLGWAESVNNIRDFLRLEGSLGLGGGRTLLRR